MIKKLSKGYIFIFLLFILNVLLFSVKVNSYNTGILKVDFLDIGQGDAIFIEAPNGTQMLIDGGPDLSVLRELSKVMKFSDRSIDIILATHPDKDHIAGLPFVLENFKVDTFIDSVADSDTNVYQELEKTALEEPNLKHYYGMRGMTVVLDRKDGVYLEILYPNQDDLKLTDTNDLSITAKLIYGETSFMLTGDAPKLVENLLDSTDRNYLKSDVLKAGHHGSRTSSSKAFVESVSPTYAIISAGLNNSYGHPHKETIETLKDEGVKILETSKEGTIRFESDGRNLWIK